MNNFKRRASALLSFLRQGRASRRRSRAGGFRWTLDGWASEPKGGDKSIALPPGAVPQIAWVSTERANGRTIFTYKAR